MLFLTKRLIFAKRDKPTQVLHYLHEPYSRTRNTNYDTMRQMSRLDLMPAIAAACPVAPWTLLRLFDVYPDGEKYFLSP
jgi:hypothetical protein